MILLVIAISCFSLLFAVYLARYVVQREMGTEKMQEISNAIKEGAEAFLSRQNRTIVTLSAFLAVLIFVLYAYVRTPNPADPVPPVELAFWTTASFVLGALAPTFALRQPCARALTRLCGSHCGAERFPAYLWLP